MPPPMKPKKRYNAPWGSPSRDPDAPSVQRSPTTCLSCRYASNPVARCLHPEAQLKPIDLLSEPTTPPNWCPLLQQGPLICSGCKTRFPGGRAEVSNLNDGFSFSCCPHCGDHLIPSSRGCPHGYLNRFNCPTCSGFRK